MGKPGSFCLRRKIWNVGLVLFLLFAGWTAARAYDAPPPRAARLSYLQGSVTVMRMDNTGQRYGAVEYAAGRGVAGDDRR